VSKANLRLTRDLVEQNETGSDKVVQTDAETERWVDEPTGGVDERGVDWEKSCLKESG